MVEMAITRFCPDGLGDPLCLVELADLPLEIRVLEKSRGFHPATLRYLENIAHMIQRSVHRVECLERRLQERSEALSNIPDPNGHYVAWMNLPQHYCTRLSSDRIEIFRNRESC